MKLPTLPLLLALAFVIRADAGTGKDVESALLNDGALLKPKADEERMNPPSPILLAQTSVPPGATPAISRKRHWEARFEELDTNRDGKLTLEEFLVGPMGKKTPEKAKGFFQTIDKDHTGSITLDQWLAAHAEEEGGAEPAPTAAALGATPPPPPRTPVASITEPPTVRRETIALKKTPPEVQKAITAAVGIAHLARVEKFEEGGRTLYTGKYDINGDMQEYTVDAGGVVARIRMYPYSMTKPIAKSVNKHVGDGKIEIIEKCFDAGKSSYRVKFITKDGKESQFSVSESGVLQ